MSKNYAIIIHFMLPLTTFYRSGAHRSDVYKWDAFVTSWRFYNRAWQPQRHDRLPETSGTLWIHRGALTNQRCSLATGCGINLEPQRYMASIGHSGLSYRWLKLLSIFSSFNSPGSISSDVSHTALNKTTRWYEFKLNEEQIIIRMIQRFKLQTFWSQTVIIS